MEQSEPTQFLKDDRQKTDDSLIAERGKTNESLTKTKGETEVRTDKAVLRERAETDEKISSSRVETDSSRVLNERRLADNAIELERTKVDVAIEEEREQTGAQAAQILEQERKLTDKSLSAERTRTDSEVLHASTLLSEEIAEHSKTRVALTTRDEFLAIVSHDLRNPIGTASSYAAMLLEDSAFSAMDSEIRTGIEVIKRNMDTSLRLIADLLDVERISHGILQLHLENRDIDQIIRESIESFAQTAAARSIQLRSIPSDFSEKVYCDHDRILQVLSNLIGNAMKFTPDGGAITISTKHNDSEVLVSVQDTGPGIPDEMKDQIFKRFAQLGLNDRRGLGLGLYISKTLVDMHGGRLWVESKPSQGSTFHFTIPKK